MPLVYDALGTNQDNFVIEENHQNIASARLMPTKGVFYKKDLLIIGVPIYNLLATIELKYLKDYIYSPPFLSEGAKVCSELFSYIILIRPGSWDSINISYRAIGGNTVDTILNHQISVATAFDTMLPARWLDFTGEASTLPAASVSPKLAGVTADDIFLLKLDDIIAQLGVPQDITDFVLLDYSHRRQELIALKHQLQVLITQAGASPFVLEVIPLTNVNGNVSVDFSLSDSFSLALTRDMHISKAVTTNNEMRSGVINITQSASVVYSVTFDSNWHVEDKSVDYALDHPIPIGTTISIRWLKLSGQNVGYSVLSYVGI